jgi:sec-independent protein translocase protein TatB
MSFWELVVIAVVALLVLGPERLPGAIRSVSSFVRNVKQFGQQMQAELNDELRVQELHDKLKQAEEKGLLNLTTEEMQAMAELRQAAADVTNPYPAANKTADTPAQAAEPLEFKTPALSVPPEAVITDDKNHKS